MQHRCLLNPDSKSQMTEQITDTTKVHLGEPLVLLVSLTGIWARGYLQQQKYLKDSCIFKTQPNMSNISQTWENRAYYIACRQFKKLGNILSKWLTLSKLLLGSLASFCFFQAANLVSESFMQLGLSESDSQQLACFLWEGGDY